MASTHLPPSSPATKRPTCPLAVDTPMPGHLTEGDGDRVGDALSQRTEPRPQNETDFRPECAETLSHHRLGCIQRLSQVFQGHERCPS